MNIPKITVKVIDYKPWSADRLIFKGIKGFENCPKRKGNTF